MHFITKLVFLLNLARSPYDFGIETDIIEQNHGDPFLLVDVWTQPSSPTDLHLSFTCHSIPKSSPIHIDINNAN